MLHGHKVLRFEVS
ncbi:hypothetical protein D030_5454A, partial [Vibrio parahaemolyticus AQ3810]